MNDQPWKKRIQPKRRKSMKATTGTMTKALRLGYDLSEVLARKFNKVSERVGSSITVTDKLEVTS